MVLIIWQKLGKTYSILPPGSMLYFLWEEIMSKEIIDINEIDNKLDNPYLVIFKKPYTFEGKDYKEVDLSGLEDLTTADLMEVDKVFSTREYVSPYPEADSKYNCMIAARACKLPIEFFIALPIKEGKKVNNIVKGFFLE